MSAREQRRIANHYSTFAQRLLTIWKSIHIGENFSRTKNTTHTNKQTHIALLQQHDMKTKLHDIALPDSYI